MPAEMFARVCKNLDPIWLVGLSATCSRMRDNLSFPLGSWIWYKAMPTSLWNDEEKRNTVRALGGPYNAHFNYKREIIRQLSKHRRCYICATTVGSDGRPVKPKCFGMILCNDCLGCYSTSKDHSMDRYLR